ncbi:delta fatty acid desaturase [Microtetraspora sp. NBRC 13810]|uniref:fatty acid desaturase family protein n=1 Tax=Microtetraspora sp. NBRC 13810 TaxID=3030990 RepID=UPI0024A53AB7|nr:acyl-CoA desaturase [Microtetraspora sp. NBRC 13810]GLW12453.1 delta fatty acid desaturase [Microtetraspora sp. NBRC 13810]
MDRRPGYYATRFGIVGLLYAGGWAAVFLIGDSWAQVLVAAVLAVVFVQVALLAHDLAHRQVFRSRRVTENIGVVVGNLLIGLGYGWWTDKHTRHHANPNHEDHDPDVSPAVIVWSSRQAEQSKGLPRLVCRMQAFLFFPLLTLEGVHLHIASFRALTQPAVKRRWTEAVLLTGHLLILAGVLFTTMSFGKALVFLAVNQAVFGFYLGCTFAPNHKGMQMLTAEDELDFLRRQVLTSRNVTGNQVVDIALGGLNYQIEHHLFPSMPMPNLRKARPIVRDYCAELGVPYQECGLFASYGQALRHMHEVGAVLRTGDRLQSTA